MFSERTRHWLGPLLFLSVAGNLFLGGLVVGRVTFSWPIWDTTAPEGQTTDATTANSRAANTESRLGERIRALPAPERRRFMVALSQNRGDLPEARRALRRAALHVSELIAAPTLDGPALTAALTEVRAATAREQNSLHAALVPALAALSPESRAALASGAANDRIRRNR